MADTRPFAVMVPAVGRWMPAISLSSVDLPEPLWPIRPYVVPRGISSETSRSAQKSSVRGCRASAGSASP